MNGVGLHSGFVVTRIGVIVLGTMTKDNIDTSIDLE